MCLCILKQGAWACSTALLQVNELCPCFILESEHLVRAPVNSVDLAVLAITSRGDREGEAIDRHLHARLRALACRCIQREALIEVFASESTHNDNCVSI